jgi:hypothetical protein
VIGRVLCGIVLVWLAPQIAAIDPVTVVAVEGTNFWVSPSGAADFIPASAQITSLSPGDRVRCGANTRLTLRLRSGGILRVGHDSEFEVRPSPPQGASLLLGLKQGLLFFFHRGSPSDVEVHTQTARAAVRGTEFVAETGDGGELTVTVIDGEVILENDFGRANVSSNEQGRAGGSGLPSKAAVVNAVTAVQW